MLSEFLTRGNLSGMQDPEKTAGVGQQFLRFHLMPDTNAMLPVHQMKEVVTVPLTQVVPIPHMPAWVMGVYNWRGEILWILDLGQLIGLTPLYQLASSRSNYTVIVIHSTEQPGKQQASSSRNSRKTLGLVVNKLEDIEWCNPDSIQSPPQSSITPELVPFLRGYWLKSNGDILVVLDGNSIIAGIPHPEGSANT